MNLVDGADTVPTTQAIAASKRVERSLDELLKRWQELKTKERAALKGGTDHAGGMSYSPDGKTLATARRDNRIDLWDMPAAKNADK